MAGDSSEQTPSAQRHPDIIVRLGGWLFRQRTWIPLPFAAVLFFVPGKPSPALLGTGLTLALAAELLRLVTVLHIGTISRTRSDRLGPLITTGPFALVRNPLYLGNILLWVGFTLSAGLPWFVPFVALALALEYHAIVRWEEQLLEARMGDAYRAYAAAVPRWVPSTRQHGLVRPRMGAEFSWGETVYSERGTLIAMVVGYFLLWIKFRVG